ncbi:MAG: carboxypeptidase-like regulatory domain-containing protein, partial [Chitinophagaceae bacterium]
MTKELRLTRKPASCIRLLLCLMFAISSFSINAQTVTGTVSNKEGDKLSGVTVNVKGTNQGTTTDADGKFSINAAAKSVLVVSSVGYAPQEIAVSGRTAFNISMVRDLRNLDEVVVTALGIKKESKRLGYSATTVSTDQLTNVRTTNLGNSLQGKVAGLNVSPPAGGPGGSSKIRIRGQSSFGGDNSPLIIVNGIPINNSSISAGGSAGNGTGNPTGGS